MDEILSIQSGVVFDESIAHYELHAHQPYSSLSFNNSDEIRITIQHQDLCLLPSRSSIHICGKLTNANGAALSKTKFVNNGICHLFDEIRYEINAVEIDRSKNVGLTSLIKGWTSFNPNQTLMLENAGWIDSQENNTLIDSSGNFDVSIPLSMILGFAEDYKKIVVNVKHELILTRARNDVNAVIQENTAASGAATYEDFKIDLTKIEWLMPYVIASDKQKIQLYNFIGKDNPISMCFRSWELHEYPLLPTTSKHIWTVKTSNQLEKPRFVILALQNKKKGIKTANASHFDHCNITNAKLFLNSQYYPYNNLNLDIAKNQFAILYDMYTNFQKSYYGREPQPLLNKSDFINYEPLIVIDCARQNESLKNAPVDVRLEFESKIDFPANTTAYCMILHDRIIQYNPISGDIKKLL